MSGLLIRLRIALTDEPGTLARITTVIADHGGDIHALDVQRGDELTVDEITVEFPVDADLASVRREMERMAGASVLSFKTASSIDLLTRLLGRVANAISAGPRDGLESVRQIVSDLFATPAVWVRTMDEAAEWSAGRQAITDPGSAVVERTAERLPPLGETTDGEACLLAIAESHRDGTHVLLAARPVAHGFTLTEIQRIEAIMAIHDRLAVMRPLAVAPA